MPRDHDNYTVEDVVDGSKFGTPYLIIISLCFLLMVCDSYDVAALSFAAPMLIKQWSIAPEAMGLIFSVGLFGLLVGSILFGWVGDRFGRKRAMIIGALCFSALTAVTGLAQSQSQLLVLRLVATIGLGGAVPNAVALVTESTPRPRRVTAVGIIFAGYSVGGIIAGLTANYIIGVMGWQMMFYIGGALSLATTVAFFFLPESLAYLATQPTKRENALRVAAFLRPDMRFSSDARILPDVVVGEAHGRNYDRNYARFADLFAGPLRSVTPLMWLIYIANSMTVFSLSSWMPVAVEAVGFPPGMAAVATAMLYTGSAVGGVLGGRCTDNWGASAIIALAALAFPTVVSLGAIGGSGWLLFPVSFLAGCFAFGGQTCLHGFVGSLYPTHLRANGVGWAIGIAKIGSISGPFIAGVLLPHLSGQQLFLAAGSPLIVVAALTLALKVLMSSTSKGDVAPARLQSPSQLQGYGA
jgi:AAHS family 4-hydroxybenzoate transporter-like MFS transporter